MSDEIDITQLQTPELLELIQDDLYDGLAKEVVASVNELLQRGMSPYDVLTKGLVAGMEVVGVDFRDGILFVPEVLMAAKAMKAGMEVLRPLLAETGAPQIGTMVIGTVLDPNSGITVVGRSRARIARQVVSTFVEAFAIGSGIESGHLYEVENPPAVSEPSCLCIIWSTSRAWV